MTTPESRKEGIAIDPLVLITRVLVIGAGPAGVSAAIGLRQLGHDVLLVERARFPREKVCGCCMNLAALAALETIQCDQLIAKLAGSPLTKWQMRMGTRRVEAPLPGGVAIGRHTMDAALADEAIRRGVDFRDACEAKITDVRDDAVDVTLKSEGREPAKATFGAVVFATGLSGGGVSKWLPFEQPPTGPVGVGMILGADEPCVAAIERQTIHMVCGVEGYVGLVRLEDDRVDVAAAIRKRGARGGNSTLDRGMIAESTDRLMTRAGLGAFAIDRVNQLRMTPMLTRHRVTGCGALIAVGDAVRYVEPFTGEGMAWAIESGVEAARCIDAHVRENTDTPLGTNSTLAQRWAKSYALLTRRRHWICASISSALGSRALSRMILPAIWVAPWAARWTISQLNQARKASSKGCYLS